MVRTSQPLFETSATVLVVAKLALPVILLGVLSVVVLFSFLSWIGVRVSGYRPLAIEELEEEEAKAREKKGDGGKKKNKKKKVDDTADQPQLRPRRLYLLAPLNFLALSYLLEGAALLFEAVIKQNDNVEDADFWPVVASLASYWLGAIMLLSDSAESATDARFLKVIAGVSLIGQPVILVALSITLASVHLFDALHIFHLVLSSIRVITAILLACAFLPRLQAVVQPRSEAEEETPLLSGGNANGHAGNGNTDGSASADASKKETEEEEDDDDEEDEKPKVRSYDFIAIFRRIQRLLPYLAPLRSRLVQVLVVVCLGLTLIQNAATVLLPRQLGFIVRDLAQGQAPWKSIAIWALLRASLGYSGLLAVLRRSLWMPVDMLASRELTVMSFQHVMDLSARYHNNKKTGELLNVLNRSDSAADFLNFGLFEVAPIVVNLAVGSVYIVIVYGWSVGAVILVTAAGYSATSLVTRRAQLAYRSKANDRSDAVAGIKNESVSNVDLVKYFSAERYEINRYSTQYTFNQRAEFEYRIFYRMVTFTQELVTNSGTLISALLVARQIVGGEKDVGSFVTFTSYLSTLLGTIGQLEWMSQYTNSLMTSTDKLMDILEEKNEIIDRPDAEELMECRGDIEFDNVTFLYEPLKKKVNSKKEPRKALENVSFKVKAGQHIALVGETGSGKSTIFKLLFRFFDISEGSIKVDGKDVRDYTQRSLRQALGVVQQEGALFNDSIMANIRYGDIAATDAQVMEAAKVAKIHERITEWPKKYHTVVGERGVKLSGGEKQRVSIARTVLKNPQILLLDEATSALDTATEKEIQLQLRKLTEGKTTMAIAHRLSTISSADLIIVLNKGKIVETGNHADLVKIEEGYYRKLWDAQIATGVPVKEEDASMGTSGIELREAE